MSATTEHAADGRAYDQRSYVDRTISTIRQHDPQALRNNWWTGAALALADEVDRLRSLHTEAAWKLRESKPHRDTLLPCNPEFVMGVVADELEGKR